MQTIGQIIGLILMAIFLLVVPPIAIWVITMFSFSLSTLFIGWAIFMFVIYSVGKLGE